MTLRNYLNTEEGKALQAVCYYGRNGQYYFHGIEKAKKTVAMDKVVDQIITGKDGKETAWLY